MDMIHRGDKNIITEKSIGDYKIRVCARCYSVVYPTETPDYSFYCPEHDEDLYEFETILLGDTQKTQ